MPSIPDVVKAADELLVCLKKYQARYHGSPHAKKDWDASNEAIKNYAEMKDRLHESHIQDS